MDEAVDEVDRGFMLIELRLIKDDVSVVERVKVVLTGEDLTVVADGDELLLVADGFVASCFLFGLTPKNDSSCSRSCRAPDDRRSDARSSFRAVPFVSLAAFGMCRLKCGDSCCGWFCGGCVSIGCVGKVFTGLGVASLLAGVGLFSAMDITLVLRCCFSAEMAVVEVPFDAGFIISNSSDFQLVVAGWVRLIFVENGAFGAGSFSSTI